MTPAEEVATIWRRLLSGAAWASTDDRGEGRMTNSIETLTRHPPPMTEQEGGGMSPEWRDYLGRVVRAAWIAWANQQPDVKVGWLLPWEELNDADQEADRMIGEAVWALANSVSFRTGYHTIGTGPPLHRLAWVLADTMTLDPARYVRATRQEDA